MSLIAIPARTKSATGDKMAKAAYGQETRQSVTRRHSSRSPSIPPEMAVIIIAENIGPNEAR
jgi:hypothetical protein